MVYFYDEYNCLGGVRASGARAGAGAVDNAVGSKSCCGAEEELKKIKASLLTLLESHFSCEICKYPCNTTVTGDCGHKFCNGCLNEKRRQLKRWENLKCPSGCHYYDSIMKITYSYWDDQIITSLLHNISPEMGRHFNSVKLRKQDDASDVLRNQAYQDHYRLQSIRSSLRKLRKLSVAFVILLPLLLLVVLMDPTLLSKNGISEPEWITNVRALGRNAGFAIRNFIKGLQNFKA